MRQNLKHKLKFSDGIALYIGKGIVTNPHRHFALEIALSFDKPFEIRTTEKIYSDCKFAIIQKDIEHQFISSQDDYQVFIYIDPFHQLSDLIEKTFLSSDFVITNFPKLESFEFPTLQEWIELETDKLAKTIFHILEQIIDIELVANKTDLRIVKSIQHINNNIHKSMSISTIAKSAFLSESRYAHLFKLEVGIPFRRYILWQRMRKTIQSILEGSSITSACYDGGFSDISHFNKAFQQMFGITPSAVLKG